MGDVRFGRAFARLQDTSDRAAALLAASTDDLIMALAAASPETDPVLTNVIATELQNRARRSLAVAEHIADAVLLMDEQGVVTFANPAAERMLGRPAPSLVGLHASDAARLLDRNGDPVPWDEQPGGRAIDAGRVQSRNDLVVGAREDARPAVAILAAAIHAEGGVIGAVASIRDVTTQRRLEEDLRFHKRLLDAVGDAVIATRPDGTVLYWNRSAQALYGWSAEEVVGRNVLRIAIPEGARTEGDAILRLLRGGNAWNGDLPLQRKDGSTFLAHVTSNPVQDDEGRLVAILAISRAAQ